MIERAPLPWTCLQCGKTADGIEIALVDDADDDEDNDISFFQPPAGWLVLPVEEPDDDAGDRYLALDGCCSVECTEALLSRGLLARRTPAVIEPPAQERRRPKKPSILSP